MKKAFIFVFCSILVGALALSALSTIQSPPPEPAADAGLDQSMDTMHGAMQKVRYSGNPDADFGSMMIPHHQGAVEMAEVELQYGTNPRLRRLAQEIIVTQQSEIEVIRDVIRNYPPSALNLKRTNWCTR